MQTLIFLCKWFISLVGQITMFVCCDGFRPATKVLWQDKTDKQNVKVSEPESTDVGVGNCRL